MSEPRERPPAAVHQLQRHPERSVPDEAAAFLAAGHVAHLGFVVDGQPFVIPFAYHFHAATPDRLYLHGSLASRALKVLASGAPVCVTVTHADGLVASKTAFDHTMNYRSVVCFGRGRAVVDAEEKQHLFTDMVSRYFPDRTPGRDYSHATPAQLAATTLVEVRIDSVSAKVRRGGPNGPHDDDAAQPGSAFVVPL